MGCRNKLLETGRAMARDGHSCSLAPFLRRSDSLGLQGCWIYMFATITRIATLEKHWTRGQAANNAM